MSRQLEGGASSSVESECQTQLAEHPTRGTAGHTSHNPGNTASAVNTEPTRKHRESRFKNPHAFAWGVCQGIIHFRLALPPQIAREQPKIKIKILFVASEDLRGTNPGGAVCNRASRHVVFVSVLLSSY